MSRSGVDRKGIWLDATIHAREWLATTTHLKIMQHVQLFGCSEFMNIAIVSMPTMNIRFVANIAVCYTFYSYFLKRLEYHIGYNLSANFFHLFFIFICMLMAATFANFVLSFSVM